MSPFTAAVVGLGRVGMGYDCEQRDAAVVLTHAHAYESHAAFELIAGVDPDRAARVRFEQRFARPAFATVQALAAAHSVDVWSIAVPTPAHAAVFADVIRCEPRAILCEKPIAARPVDARGMVDAAASAGCALQVNYMRRFEPGVLTLRRMVQRGECGDIGNGVVWYSGGFLNNGSHFVDLLRFLLGEPAGIEVVGDACPRGAGDFDVDVRIRFGSTDVYFLVPRVRDLTIAEFMLIGTRAAIRYLDAGRTIQVTMNGNPRTLDSDIGRYQWHVVDALRRHLVHGVPLASDGRSAAETLDVVESVRLAVAARSVHV